MESPNSPTHEEIIKDVFGELSHAPDTELPVTPSSPEGAYDITHEEVALVPVEETAVAPSGLKKFIAGRHAKKQARNDRQSEITQAVVDNAIPPGGVLSLSKKERRHAIKASRRMEKVIRDRYRSGELEDTFRPPSDPVEREIYVSELRQSSMNRADRRAAVAGIELSDKLQNRAQRRQQRLLK